jgi:hypothetical protein
MGNANLSLQLIAGNSFITVQNQMDCVKPFSHIGCSFFKDCICKWGKRIIAVMAMAYFVSFPVFIDFDFRPAVVAG